MTTTTALATRNAHLAQHRRMILTRALASGLVGLVPLPYLDDWLVAVVRRGTIRRIADARGVDLDEAATRVIAEGNVPPPSWKHLVTSTAVTSLMQRAVRRWFLVYSIAKRAEDARRSFAVGTLFDHYCARLHVGAGLDGKQGRRVRLAIEEAMRKEPAGISARVFGRALATGGRAALKAPFRLIDGLSGGLIRKALKKGDEAHAEEVVEEALARADGGNFLARAYRTVDEELSRAGNGWQDELVSAFERIWQRGKVDGGSGA